METNDTISTLNGLIETCRDGQNGFQEASTNVKNSGLKSLFAEASTERAKFVGDLQQEVRGLGGDPENTGSVTGAVHRAWIDVKGTFTGQDDAAILNECERGEDSAVSTYRDALATQLPANIRTLVETQYTAVQSMHDRIRSRRDRAAGA